MRSIIELIDALDVRKRILMDKGDRNAQHH